MSVVVQNSAGWFLDACSFIDQGHSSCMRYSKDGKQSGFKCCFKRQCFRANKSYCSAHASAVTDGGMADVLPNSDKHPKVIIIIKRTIVGFFCKREVVFRTLLCSENCVDAKRVTTYIYIYILLQICYDI